jgi:hypothetical protein
MQVFTSLDLPFVSIAAVKYMITISIEFWHLSISKELKHDDCLSESDRDAD